MYLEFHTLTPGKTTKVASQTTKIFYTTARVTDRILLLFESSLPLSGECVCCGLLE